MILVFCWHHLGHGSFSCDAPRLWIPLPSMTRFLPSLSTFKSRLQHEVTTCTSISIPPCMGCHSITWLPPALSLPALIYTPAWREALCPGKGSNPNHLIRRWAHYPWGHYTFYNYRHLSLCKIIKFTGSCLLLNFICYFWLLFSTLPQFLTDVSGKWSER